MLHTLFNTPGGRHKITNYSENLATEIRSAFGLDIDTTWWIEHYPPNPMRKHHGMTKEFDQITYAWDLRTLTADDPAWHRLNPQQLQPLLHT